MAGKVYFVVSLHQVRLVYVFLDVRVTLVVHDVQDLNDQFCQSPSNKQPPNVLHDDNTDSILEENVLSPSPHCLSNEDEISRDNRISTIGHNIKHLTEVCF